MNVVREINKINERELDLGTTGSWHDDYKDSAYIFVGGLHTELTEGDVITIFSQYGEVMDVNLPRDKNTGKTKGFGFLMYEDQRSTVLAVDNLNGSKVLERTLRVDHVRDYKQPKVKTADGEMTEREEQSLNAKPQMVIDDDAASDSSESDYADIDPEDPMRDYLIASRKEEKAAKKLKSKGKDEHKNETPEERRARKEKKRQKKLKKQKTKSEGLRGVEDLLNELESMSRRRPTVRRSSSANSASRSPSQERQRRRDDQGKRSSQYSPPRRNRSSSPPVKKRMSRARPPTPPRDSHRSDFRRDDHDGRRDQERDHDRSPPRRREQNNLDLTSPMRRRENRN